MKFLIATHVKHAFKNGEYYAYGPYVKEMNLWLKNVDEVIIVAPLKTDNAINNIDLAYNHSKIKFVSIPSFDFNSPTNAIGAIIKIPFIFYLLFVSMINCNHIHLRCPGNIGLLGAMIQILFPFKTKTAKYAGNWDWKSKQPLSYRVQQYILRSTFFSHRMKVLVYGEYADKTKNILPFFTASYTEVDKMKAIKAPLTTNEIIQFVFVGTLTPNKNPDLAISFVKEIIDKGYNAELHFYGEGPMHMQLDKLSIQLKISNSVIFHGNVNANELKLAYQKAHFLLLLSESEGWPKAVAEAMWFGCIPISRPVSCVPWMLEFGKRGILLSPNALNETIEIINNPIRFSEISISAQIWSEQYTLEKFEKEISKLI